MSYEELELPGDWPTTRVVICNAHLYNAACSWPLVVDVSLPTPGLHFEPLRGHENGDSRHSWNYWVVRIVKGKKHRHTYANVLDLDGKHITFVDFPFIDRKLKKLAKQTNSVILEVQNVE